MGCLNRAGHKNRPFVFVLRKRPVMCSSTGNHMSIIQSVRNGFSPIHPEGYPFIAAFFIGSLILGWLWIPLFWAGLVLTLWCVYFFRDPVRVVPVSPDIVVSPADGRISALGPVVPPEKLGLAQVQMIRVSIFMDVFSCHVNRIPAGGVIKSIVYCAGKFANAELDKASEHNERNSLLIHTAHGDIGVVQVAGLVARRIVCWAKTGDEVVSGARFGLIRFGSRLDIYLPADITVRVGTGQKVVAGETVIASFDKSAVPADFRLD